MSFMAIKGTEWASAIDPAPTPSLFLSAAPDGAVVLDFNPEGGDLLVMSKHMEGALLPVLIVQVEMRGQNSIVAWSFTPTALAAVLSDLWDVWDVSWHFFFHIARKKSSGAGVTGGTFFS